MTWAVSRTILSGAPGVATAGASATWAMSTRTTSRVATTPPFGWRRPLTRTAPSSMARLTRARLSSGKSSVIALSSLMPSSDSGTTSSRSAEPGVPGALDAIDQAGEAESVSFIGAWRHEGLSRGPSLPRGSGSRSLRARGVTSNEPRPTPVREIRPRPGDHHDDSVLETNQIPDVDEQPRHPCEQPRHVHPVQHRDRPAATDRRHASFVRVLERKRVFPHEEAPDRPSDRSRLLHGDGAHARQRLTALVIQACCVADDERPRLPGHREVLADQHAAHLVEAHPEGTRETDRAHTRGPQDDRARDPFVAE